MGGWLVLSCAIIRNFVVPVLADEDSLIEGVQALTALVVNEARSKQLFHVLSLNIFLVFDAERACSLLEERATSVVELVISGVV